MLAAISGVLALAVDLGILEQSPVSAFREQLSRRNRTKRGRAETEAGRTICPIEDAVELARLTESARSRIACAMPWPSFTEIALSLGQTPSCWPV